MPSKIRPSTDFETAVCLVCRTVFGRRDKTVLYKAHCDECRATYWFKPGSDRPNVVMDSFKPDRGYCTAQGCVCRD